MRELTVHETCSCGAVLDVKTHWADDGHKLATAFRDAHRVCRERPIFTDTSEVRDV